MQIKPRLYPHPVLAWFSDDYQNCVYSPEINVEGKKEFFRVSMTCNTSSNSLNELIQQKKAAYAVHVECTSTRYRSLFISFENNFIFDIPAGNVDGRVDVCRLILAQSEIHNYSSSEFHLDFDGRSFPLIPGDTLSVAEDLSFAANKKDDELAKLPSIFSIVRNSDVAPNPVDIDISGQKIKVLLAPDLYQSFTYLNNDILMRSTLSSQLLLPALVFTLEKITTQSDYSELMDLRWYRVLAKKMKEMNIEITNLNISSEVSLVLANKLLGDPISNSLKDLENVVVGGY
jgi:hypothetical protein